MTNEKLNKGNKLKNDLMDINSSISDITKVIKNIELNGFRSKTIEVGIDNQRCRINTDSLIEYLNTELNTTKQLLEKQEEEFNTL